MKFLVPIFLFAFAFFINAQESVFDKDLSQRPSKFDNFETTGGGGTPIPFASFSESFEGTTFPPAGWLKASPDGGSGWTRITAGTTPLPGWNGGTAFPPHSGAGTGMAYATWNTGGASSNDQWLITPQITNVQPGDSLTVWIRKFSDLYADNVDIRISTTTQTVAAMTTVVQNIVYAATDTGWVRRAYDIGALVPAGSNIYIGFREHVANNINDGAAIFLDDINVIPVIPVELTAFNATSVNDVVNLSWATATEINNKGFEVQRMQNGIYSSVGFVNGKGTTTEVQTYSFSERVSAGSYSYRLKQVDYNGQYEYSDEINVDVMGPVEFALAQNFPNPFNPSTKITFSLKVDSEISLKVFNVLGQEVASVLNGNFAAGTTSIDFNADGLNSGVYIYKIEAKGIDGSSFTSVKKMILTK